MENRPLEGPDGQPEAMGREERLRVAEGQILLRVG